jgi:4-amino-4-deoxy-L-arabinose transferase-like glycosyltransferase
MAVVLRIICLTLADAGVGEADATARVLFSLKWLNDPFIFPPTNWPPLQFYIYGLTLMVVPDSLYVPILINIIFGSLLVVITGYFVRRLTDDSLTGLIAALVVCFYPLAIRYSLIAVPEVILNFFIFLSLFILVGIKKSESGNKKYGQSILASIAMVAAVLTHLQAWFLMPIFSLLLWKRWINWLIFVSICLLPIIAFVFHLHSIYGVVVPPAWETASYDSSNRIRQTLYYPALLIDTLSPALILLCVIGSLKIWEEERLCLTEKYFPMFCFLALIPPYLFFVYSWDRMRSKEALLLCLFIVPYVAIGLRFLVSTMRGSLGRWLVIFTSIGMLLVIPYNWKYMSKGTSFPIPRTSPEYRQVATWLKENIEPNDGIVFDHLVHWADYYLVLATRRMPDQVFLGSDTLSRKRLMRLKRFIIEKRPRFLVLSKQPSTVSAALEMRCSPSGCPETAREPTFQIDLIKEFETKSALIYKISHLPGVVDED